MLQALREHRRLAPPPPHPLHFTPPHLRSTSAILCTVLMLSSYVSLDHRAHMECTKAVVGLCREE